MKHGKVPTVAQSNLIANYRYKGKLLNPDNWLVVKNLPDKLVIKHRVSPSVLEIPKGGG
jgi:hypothetical protein